MARDISNAAPISSLDSLIAHHRDGCKPEGAFRIGTEHEKFAFFRDGHRPVPYDGDASISALLNGMKARLGWEPILDEGRIIGLTGPQGMGAISLEPGGQFELSGAPVSNLHETCKEAGHHLSILRGIAEPLGIRFLGAGSSPKWHLDDTPAMPKSRYEIMRRYMPKIGSRGLDMMYRTCTIQVNLDYSSEADMCRKMQVSMKLQPLATAIFAASPFTEGRPNNFLSWRSDVWRDTDNARAGILPFVFNEDFGFVDYVKWALDVPMYFVIRDGKYRDCTHITFRQFLDGALKGEIDDWQPNMGDWTNHLSTLFPEVRLKSYLEMRGADGGPLLRICALPAFWVGLLYDNEALQAAQELTADWTYEEVLALRNEVPTHALNASFRGEKLLHVAEEVMDLVRLGLKNRDRRNSDGYDERIFLAPIEDMLARGTTLAEDMLNHYRSRSGSIDSIFEQYQC
ncbi:MULTISPECIES: glutamate--cysteine ligase [Paraburkholderia]|uniref:glutamate--cysteine ligase n=1 Tax=Paraburkholderia TaxID=1822464 RepID=UPI00224DD0EB|nr:MULTISPECIES: glutamate--cysteine ligase [Paraburkholderia]MCX4162736.1 glutamate--cysteine ligase [Paraburkholderia megapolitana]MDN7158231.1 glutamate--cysteine ligase [Paraburkholderia sp. CHISQ3]MDQ6495278.1 glutamate--cysteine ligase [Paraburkholderia megapolitana]